MSGLNGLYTLLWVFALYIWGDWRNWKKYYPTILFFALGDFIYLYLLSDHYPMWKYQPKGLDENIGLTNSHISLSIILIKYPATAMIYLYRFPEKNKIFQFLYVVVWDLIYTLNEMIDFKLNLIKYYNGWNLYWSMFFNLIMFLILKAHFKWPLLAWLFSIVFILFLWKVFDVPKEVFR